MRNICAAFILSIACFGVQAAYEPSLQEVQQSIELRLAGEESIEDILKSLYDAGVDAKIITELALLYNVSISDIVSSTSAGQDKPSDGGVNANNSTGFSTTQAPTYGGGSRNSVSRN